MNNQRKIYYSIMTLSIILFAGTIFFLNDTKIIAPIIMVFCVYLFLGSIIKLCKTNEKFKNNVLFSLDLLFWLP